MRKIYRRALALLLCAVMLLACCAAAEEDACNHENCVPVVDFQPVVYTPVDAESHRCTEDMMIYTECQDCGLRFSGKPGEANVWTERHGFADGVCVDCGYVCPHGHVSDYGYFERIDSAEPIDATSHQATGLWVTDRRCDDCYMSLENEEIEGETRVLDHSMTDEGFCWACGYGCDHESTSEYYDLEDLTFAEVDDEYHQTTGRRIDYVRCEKCFYALERKEEPYSALDGHSYNEAGVCELCGHVCGHSSTYTDMTFTGERYTPRDKWEHVAAGTERRVTTCVYCDKALGDVTEPRTYDESYDHEDGKCAKCGYQCPHSYVYTDTEVDEDSLTYRDSGSESTHDAVCRAEQFERCADCGTRLSAAKAVEVRKPSEHSYEDGVCVDCGHVRACKHENVKLSEYDVDDAKTRYEDTGDDAEHNVVSVRVMRNLCLDCGEWVGEAVSTVEKREPEGHEYDENNVCPYCGHANACAHANAYLRPSGYDERSSEDTGSEATHRSVYTNYRLTLYCPDCRSSLSEEVRPTYVEELEHDYEDRDVCVSCGHKRACAHENAFEAGDFRTITGYTPLTGVTHSYSGEYVRSLYCPDCGKTLEELSAEERTETEAHEFSEYGYCYQCGFINNCPHEHIVEKVPEYQNYVMSTQYVNEGWHRVVASVASEDYCLDCGQRVGESEQEDTLMERHSFDRDGVCVDCGYRQTCGHGNVHAYTYQIGKAVCEDVGSDVVHQATRKLMRNLSCLDCGETLEDALVDAADVSMLSHDYDANGVCKDCGHARKCDHAETDTSSYSRGRTYYTDIGSDEVHLAQGAWKVTTTGCSVCGIELERLESSNYSEEESHAYMNGVCQDCGHVNACKHERTQTQTDIVGQTRDAGDKGHVNTGYEIESVFCETCGETLSSKLLNRNASVLEEHWYDGGICLACGHVEPKKKPAETKAEAADSAELELVYVPVEALDGVRASDRLPAREAMATVGDALGDVWVDIPAMGKLLTAGEKAAFDVLSVHDRLLVTLTVIGLDSADEAVSDAADKLVEVVKARVGDMTDDEKRAWTALRDELFPHEDIEIDEVIHDSVKVDVVIDRAGDKTHQRYTFIDDDGQWVLYGIEVGRYVEKA